MTTSAYAPWEQILFQRTNYLSAQEYQSSPTAMDCSNLIPGGSAQANLESLVETIGRASSWIDQHCMGVAGTLCATSNIENARIWGSYRNTLLVRCKYWPVVEVQSFEYSTLPAGLANNNTASITPAGNIVIYPQQFEVSLSGVVGWGLGAPAGIVRGVEYTCQFQYVNGWPTSTLSASVAAGAASIAPISTEGIYPGITLTLYDLPNDEQVQVASSYVPHTTPVPLVGTTQYAHASGVMVSNLPPAVKQAAILVTTAFIKQRGSGALVVADMGAVTKQQTGFSQNAGSDWAEAKDILQTFKQTYVGY